MSRKLIVIVGIAAVLTIAWVVTAFFPLLQPGFTTLAGGLVGLAGVYATGNVAEKYVLGRHLAASQKLASAERIALRKK